MACNPSAERTALTALAPEAHYLASGTMSCADCPTMKIYSLHFRHDTHNVQFLAESSSPDRVNRLCWSRPAAAEDPSFSLGLLAGGLCNGSVALWNPLRMISLEGQTGDAKVVQLEKHNGPVTGIDFSVLEPSLLASGSTKGDVHIWDLKMPREPKLYLSLKSVASSAEAERTCLTWNPELTYALASGYSNGTTVIWDLREHKPSTSFQDSDRRNCAVMSWNPNESSHLIVASDDDNSPSLRVWDVRKASTPVQELKGHSKGVIAMAWCTYDSSFLLTCGKDRRIICWDTVGGEIISELPTSSNNNIDINWYRQTPVVIEASFDGTVGISSLDFSGIYAAGGASAPRKSPAPKWLKCPQQAGTSEVEANVVEKLPEQIGTSCEKDMKCAKSFAEKFYKTLNERPGLLHQLYAEGSTANWPNADGEMVQVSGAKALQNLFASKIEVCKDFVMSTISVLTSKKDCVLIVATGRFTTAERRISKFSQSFVLTAGGDDFFILNDVMTVLGFHQDVCVIYDHAMRNHCANSDERPERIASIMRKFNKLGLLQRVVIERPPLVNDKEISRVHEDPEYLAFIKELPLSYKKKKDFSKFFNARNISFSDGTLPAVLLSAGAVVKACKLVATGRYDHAFAVVRPPGHHATANYADGFCFLNNIAIGAMDLILNYGMKKILVVDFDVHHGDGTQKIFFNDGQVLFFSTHRGEDFFPNNGGAQEETGLNGGQGRNINVCLPKGFGDDDLLAAFEYVLLPVAREFDADIILVSAGYDAAKGDTIGECNVTPPCYGTIIDMLKQIPSKKGLVLALEGGYDLSALAESAAASLKSLLGDRDDLLNIENYCPQKGTWDAIIESRKILSSDWPVLASEIPQEVLDRHRAPSVVAPGAALQPTAAATRQSRRLADRRAQAKDPGKRKSSH